MLILLCYLITVFATGIAYLLIEKFKADRFKTDRLACLFTGFFVGAICMAIIINLLGG
jgi:hypothetical protein